MIELIIGIIMMVSVLCAYIPQPQYMCEMTFWSNMAGAVLFLSAYVLEKVKHKKLPHILYLTETVTISIVFLISVVGTLSGIAHFNFSGGMFFCHVINPILVFLYYVFLWGERKFRIADLALSPMFLLAYLLFDYIRFLITGKLVYGMFPADELTFWTAVIIGLMSYVITAVLGLAIWGISKGLKNLEIFDFRKEEIHMKTTPAQREGKRYDRFRKLLIFWTLFIGIGAVAGSAGMLLDPTGKAMGMDATLPYFKALPLADILYRDFVFPGIALLIVNGITNLTAAVLLICRRKMGIQLGMIFGITLMLWICIQFYMFPPNFMSTIYFVFGLLQAITGYVCLVFYQQEQFTFDESAYQRVGTNPKELVVYFSRMGYVKKIAYEKANSVGADILELKTDERVSGTLGFWWCGRFAMHRWGMNILPLDRDVSKYEHITVCTPVWDFAVCAPIRTFLTENKDRLKRVDFVIVHYMKNRLTAVEKELRALSVKPDASCESLCCRMGVVKKIYKARTYIEEKK
ncbi:MULTISPECIES: hypothetical protein [unclassified Ruminococcus]|uniref:hypothetical protein n=1 Tax=unclassified Ruminococcus TaxID=2608920 RepID=UPI00210CD469|nr:MULTISPECIES: hypothetical protein [unclassified Ruminococcus]MCQ4022508.1 hypothetical protein [Ruminococcus sp. zg-924]MCQ4115149.1 hypothetical protein [Ruminococcus sp. zg-921]